MWNGFRAFHGSSKLLVGRFFVARVKLYFLLPRRKKSDKKNRLFCLNSSPILIYISKYSWGEEIRSSAEEIKKLQKKIVCVCFYYLFWFLFQLRASSKRKKKIHTYQRRKYAQTRRSRSKLIKTFLINFLSEFGCLFRSSFFFIASIAWDFEQRYFFFRLVLLCACVFARGCMK